MSQTDDNWDCIVLGGGPAGATAGALLARYGHRTLILERGRFPRFHIGESLMPETYWTFKRLGVLEKLRQSHFVKKYSVQFVSASGRESTPFYFDEMNPHECSQTWQVLRSEFDKMMLDHAADCGAEVWHSANASDVICEPKSNSDLPAVRGVVVACAGAVGRRLGAKVVVDATGTSALIARKFAIHRPDPALRKASIFAHYRGGRRAPGRDEGATLVLHALNQDGWFWHIPLPDDIVSVGVVADIDYLIKNRSTPEKTLDEEIARCQALQHRIGGAKRVSAVHVLSDFSYGASRCAGDGWVLVGDAFSFLDPIYSSGVFLALKSAELAADCIHDCLRKDDLSAKQLGRWGNGFNEGLQAIRKLVYAFYTKGFSFGKFIRAHPEYKKNLVDLLVGDVFRPEVGAIFEPMSRWCAIPEPMKLERS